MRIIRIGAFLAVLLACGCRVAWTPVAYQAKALTNVDPAEVAVTLIAANTRDGCVTEPAVNGAMLHVKFVCNWGIGNTVVRFDQVQEISLHKTGAWYMVRVEHHSGHEPFEWASKAQSDIEKLADALHTLSSVGSPATEDGNQSL